MNHLPRHLICFIAISLAFCPVLVSQCHDVRVAKDGTGDFTSVQEAIDEAPDDLTSPHVIFIARGVYDEKLFIEKNFITLIGEDRDSTIITTAVLRRVWRENNPSDWGAATINIASDATDLTLAHLTVRNNFADVYPDFPDNNDHTFAIRGGGHRVIIIDCNIVATGGDTLSLWNTDGGMFYHNACYFEGWVDYLAPRGYCYIADSRFFGHNSTASIWHDGSGGEDHRFVIRNAHFDGVTNFALGRYHRDAAFYLLDCTFSETMQNREIYHTGSDPLMWGNRVYYFNCHRPFFDWPWMGDNLESAVGSPQPAEVDAEWTYGGVWDPESQLDGLVPQAFLPAPAQEEGCVEGTRKLQWIPGHCVTGHRVFFGTEDPPPFVGTTDTAWFDPGQLELNQKYFWGVDEISATDTVEGPTWSFRTRLPGNAPGKATAPDPPDGQDYFTNVIRLDWSFTTCDTDSFYVYYGTSPESLEFEQALKYPAYFRPLDDPDSIYYWRVDSKSHQGVTRGDVWSFTLNPTPTSVYWPDHYGFVLHQSFPNPFTDITRVRFTLARPGEVAIRVYDSLGNTIAEIPAKRYPAGGHTVNVMEADDHIPGIYFCEVAHGAVRDTVKIVLQK